MNGALIIAVGTIFFIVAYRFYASFLSQKIFSLGDIKELTPANQFRDDIDFVPAPKGVLFGHHFSSIAGAAPIVGPAVAVIWGWLPAVLWIVFGVIFMGAAHDFGVLAVSMHHKGKSIAEVAEQILGKKIKLLFLSIIFFLVWMVIAVFALVIANLFISYPSSVIPINFEIIVALIFGLFINKRGISLTIPSILAQLILFFMIYLGTIYPVSLKSIVGVDQELMVWIIFLLIYSFFASVLPVWVLLQPRDYINCHQLFLGLGLMSVGVFVVSPMVVAPTINTNPVGAPPWFPFLFITIACGAISGFHGLVSGGTTSKQVNQWKDAKPIGYGSMLGEGLLALLATVAVATGFDSPGAWHQHYSSWNAANGLSAKINAFVLGAGSFLEGLGISKDISQTVIAVLIISFAATSLDTASRIQRYIISEIGEAIKFKPLENRFVASFLAVGSAYFLMISGDSGKGGLKLWPLFGATNQMLAGLTLIVLSAYLFKNKKNGYVFLVPASFVIILTSIALLMNTFDFYQTGNYFLTILSAVLLTIQFFVVIIGVKSMRKS